MNSFRELRGVAWVECLIRLEKRVFYTILEGAPKISSANGLKKFVAVAAASLGLVFICTFSSSALAAPGDTTRASVTNSGGQAEGGDSVGDAISADGRYVVFSSNATNLVSGDTNERRDVFVRDRKEETTKRISLGRSGSQGNGHSGNPSVSDDGRYVVFYSSSSNLVEDDNNDKWDVFIRDLQEDTTRIVSVSNSGASGNDSSDSPVVSNDGRYVVFQSMARNLVKNDTNGDNEFFRGRGRDIFIRDMQEETTRRVSVGNDGSQADNGSAHPSVSSDGRYVTFQSFGANLVKDDTNNKVDVFVRDLQEDTTRRVSVDDASAGGNGHSQNPSVSDNGRYVAFDSYSTNLIKGDTNSKPDIFVRDLQEETTTRVSVDDRGGETDDNSLRPSMSSDGRYVVFRSRATNLDERTDGREYQIFVRDLQKETTKLVSVNDSGEPGMNGESRWEENNITASISADNRFVVFTSYDQNLVEDDTNGVRNVYDGEDVFVTKLQKADSANTPPAAEDDSYSVVFGEALTVDAPGILENDSDPDSDDLTARVASGPENGELTLNEDGSFEYTPNEGFSGEDSFTYQASDGKEGTDTATVNITVEAPSEPPNAPPAAADDNYTTDEDTRLTVGPEDGILKNDSDPDGDSITAELVYLSQSGVKSGPKNGNLEMKPDGIMTYDPSPNFNGRDSFTYRVCDDNNGSPLCSEPAEVTIDVNPVNDGPRLKNDVVKTRFEKRVRFGVLANDTDIDGRLNRATVRMAKKPEEGRIKRNTNGTFIYTPGREFSGRDSFTYRVCDNGQPRLCDTATVRIRVAVPRADLGIDVKAKKRLRQGENFLYTMNVTNAGPDRALDTRVRSRLPRGVRLLRAPESCEYEASKRMVSCDLGSVLDGRGKARKMVLKATGKGSVRLTGVVWSESRDQNVSNNRDRQ